MPFNDILLILNVMFVTLAILGFISFIAYNAGVKRAKKDYETYFGEIKWHYDEI